MYLYSCIALISFLIVFQNSMTLLGFGRDHLREAAVSHQCNGGRRFSLRMKPHQPNGEVRGRQGASTVTGMVQDDESCRCTCRASFFSTSAPVSSSHRIARNPSFRARTAGLRRTRSLTLIMATPTGFQSLRSTTRSSLINREERVHCVLAATPVPRQVDDLPGRIRHRSAHGW